uniref:Uncharacterized protein n=1 Tax=Oryza punctata TaxID=4537 RepID=A0A0E0LGJ9_ORYPU
MEALRGCPRGQQQPGEDRVGMTHAEFTNCDSGIFSSIHSIGCLSAKGLILKRCARNAVAGKGDDEQETELRERSRRRTSRYELRGPGVRT